MLHCDLLRQKRCDLWTARSPHTGTSGEERSRLNRKPRTLANPDISDGPCEFTQVCSFLPAAVNCVLGCSNFPVEKLRRSPYCTHIRPLARLWSAIGDAASELVPPSFLLAVGRPAG